MDKKSKNYGWRSLQNSKPEINKLVEVQHMMAGTHGRQVWISTGRFRKSGMWVVRGTEWVTPRIIKDYPPTHWR